MGTMENMVKLLSEEEVQKVLDLYRPVMLGAVTTQPDVGHLYSTVDELITEYDGLSGIPEQNYARFLDTLEKPMPIFIGEPAKGEDGFDLQWDASYDLQGDALTYTVLVGRDPWITTPVIRQEGLMQTATRFSLNNPGRYYVRILIEDQKGNRQYAFDNFEDEEGVVHSGVREFFVEETP